LEDSRRLDRSTEDTSQRLGENTEDIPITKVAEEGDGAMEILRRGEDLERTPLTGEETPTGGMEVMKNGASTIF
jgi:hypothetical protein